MQMDAAEFLHALADLIQCGARNVRNCKDCGKMLGHGVRCLACDAKHRRTLNAAQHRRRRQTTRAAKAALVS